MKLIDTSVLINVALEPVWQAIIDFENYGLWNPFIVRAEGQPLRGREVRIGIQLPGRSIMPYKIRIVDIERFSKLCWMGRMFLPGILDGTHTYELKSVSNSQTRVTQKESFRGILVPFVWRDYLDTSFRQGFEQSNKALKEFLENKEEHAS